MFKYFIYFVGLAVHCGVICYVHQRNCGLYDLDLYWPDLKSGLNTPPALVWGRGGGEG